MTNAEKAGYTTDTTLQQYTIAAVYLNLASVCLPNSIFNTVLHKLRNIVCSSMLHYDHPPWQLRQRPRAEKLK